MFRELFGNSKKEGEVGGYLVFFLFLIFYLVVSYYLVYHLKFVFGDAVSRTEKAFLTLYDNEPKLASLGFIWTPLPSLLQIPLVLLKDAALHGFSGNVLSSIFGAFSCLYVYKFLRRTRINLSLQVIFVLIYGLNPMIVFYSANGMSESIFIFFLLLSTWHYLEWKKSAKINDLILMGISLSMAFLSRYEAVPFALLMGVLILFTYYFGDFRGNFKFVEGSFIVYFAPISFVILLWIIANWLITGDPLHFLRGQYSNIDQTKSISGNVKELQGYIFDSLLYVGKRVFFLFPVFVVILLFFLFKQIRRPSYLAISLIALSLAVPVFEYLMILTGGSFGWLRFFIYVIPFSFVLISEYFSCRKVSSLLVGFFLVLFMLSDVSSGMAMHSEVYGKEEYQLFDVISRKRNIDDSNTYTKDLEVATYVNENLKGHRILIDDFTGFGIILESLNPRIFINNSDNDYAKSLSDPANNCDYILARKPEGIGTFDAINKKFPDLFYDGAPFAALYKDFGLWRLYKIDNEAL